MSLPDLVRYTDGYLRVGEIQDWPNALNGLQIENDYDKEVHNGHEGGYPYVEKRGCRKSGRMGPQRMFRDREHK